MILRSGLAALAACVFAAAAVAAEADDADEYGAPLRPQRIVVTATRIPTPVAETPASVTVFPAAPVLAEPLAHSSSSDLSGTDGFAARLLGRGGAMEARQYRDVADALRATPGVDIETAGGFGGTTAMRIRGMDTRHTLTLLDGMPMADPATPNRETDLSGLSLDNIGQLEILRGPQSVLHGSSALGGVVSLSSARGEGPFSGGVTTEGGSHGTVMTRLKAQAGNEKGDFSLGGSVLHSDGISAATRWRGNREKDSYDRSSVNIRLGYNIGDNLRLDLFANGASWLTDLDYNSSPDTHTYQVRGKRFMARPQATLSLFDGRWEQRAGFGVVAQDRQYKDRPGTWSGRSRYSAETTKFDYQSLFRTHESNAIVAGVDIQSEKMKTRSVGYGAGKTPSRTFGATTLSSVYVEDRFNWNETLFLNAGFRYDHHDRFGDKVTWKAGAGYLLPTGTRLKATAGTGFNAPSLDVLFNDYGGGTIPNPDLKPETSFGWDVGFEQSFLEDRIAFGAAYFHNKAKNKIQWFSDPLTWVMYYKNSERYRSEGVESFARFTLRDSVQISIQHTWQTGRQGLQEFDNHRALNRRPKHTASLNVDWLLGEKGTITAGVRHVGKRRDGNNALPSHTTARIAASWRFNDRLEVFGRVENLFNKKYEEVHGYGAMGIGFFSGATLSF